MIWLWDTSQKDNNTSVHPGKGLILPVDAHAKPLKWADGTLMRNRIQAFDSSFSWFPTDSFKLHKADVAQRIAAQAGKPVFDDRKGTYWYEENPTAGVDVPDTNTKISIVKEPLSGSTVTVKVDRSTK